MAGSCRQIGWASYQRWTASLIAHWDGWHFCNGDFSYKYSDCCHLSNRLADTLLEANGKMATKALQAEVRDAGHSWDAAKRLKKSLGIEAKKLSMGGAWVWCLPE